MAGDEDQLMLFVDVDHWQQWIVEWSGGTTTQVVLVPDVHYWVVFISVESIDVDVH